VVFTSCCASDIKQGKMESAGTWHNITNIGTKPMQVYAIYSPAHHTPGKVQATAAAAEADKDDEPAAWSVQNHALDKHG
jgi:hypothetical protein